MTSPTDGNAVARLLHRLAPRSIVARTTLSILGLALLFGVLFSAGAAWLIHLGEVERLRSRLDELLATVESTASIACYVNDTALAQEIGRGLMSNEVVSAMRIASQDASLYEQKRAGLPVDESGAIAVRRALHSPFDAREVVGEIVLYSSRDTIGTLAWHSTRMVLLALVFQLALGSLGVAWVVFRLITRPIKSISDELHRLEVRTGVRLQVPEGNHRDEIGRLVSDVNALIGKLSHLIDAERRLRVEREVGERRLATIFEKVDAGMFEIDAAGNLHNWNPAFVRTLGAPGDPPKLQQLLGVRAGAVDELIRLSMAAGQARDADLEVQRADGAAQWIEMSLTPLDEHTLQGVINDITGHKHSEQAARDLAARDTLTGLLNRRGFDTGLQAAFERTRKEPGLGLAILGMDLDYFKQVNDHHGHDAGDQVLRQTARVLEQAVRRSDIAGRYGGDEFEMALVGVDGPEKALAIAEYIISGVMQPIDLGNGVKVKVGASIGIAFVRPGDSSPADAIHRADRALYAAKQAGRCRAVVAEEAETAA